jgi:hypothetical protein
VDHSRARQRVRACAAGRSPSKRLEETQLLAHVERTRSAKAAPVPSSGGMQAEGACRSSSETTTGSSAADAEASESDLLTSEAEAAARAPLLAEERRGCLLASLSVGGGAAPGFLI